MTPRLVIDTDLLDARCGAIAHDIVQAWTGAPAGQRPAAERTASEAIREQVVVSPKADPYAVVTLVRDAVRAGSPNVVKLFPGHRGDGFPLITWVLGPLTALCERDGYALSVDYGSTAPAPLAELAEFAREAPEVPILLLGEHLDPRLGFWQLLDRCPNVLLEVTPAVSGEHLRDAVDRFGAHRFAFGSRGHNVGEPLLPVLDDAARDAVLRTSADQLDHATWRDSYL